MNRQNAPGCPRTMNPQNTRQGAPGGFPAPDTRVKGGLGVL